MIYRSYGLADINEVETFLKMIYPGNHDAIKTLIDGDYNERKFYDCQDQAILLKACYSQQNIIINNWKLLNKILIHAIVQLCMD